MSKKSMPNAKRSRKPWTDITLENLKKASSIVNERRKALQRLSRLRAADPLPISGLDALLINQISFKDLPIVVG